MKTKLSQEAKYFNKSKEIKLSPKEIERLKISSLNKPYPKYLKTYREKISYEKGIRAGSKNAIRQIRHTGGGPFSKGGDYGY